MPRSVARVVADGTRPGLAADAMRFHRLPMPGCRSGRSRAGRRTRAASSRGCTASANSRRTGWLQRMVQSSLSALAQRGTVRGMHFQWPPSQEGKLVRCIRGAHLRCRDRPAAGSRHLRAACRARADCGRAGARVFIPPGLAHGFQTLEDDVRGAVPDDRLLRSRRWPRACAGTTRPSALPGPAGAAIHERDAGYRGLRCRAVCATSTARRGGWSDGA